MQARLKHEMLHHNDDESIFPSNQETQKSDTVRIIILHLKTLRLQKCAVFVTVLMMRHIHTYICVYVIQNHIYGAGTSGLRT